MHVAASAPEDWEVRGSKHKSRAPESVLVYRRENPRSKNGLPTTCASRLGSRPVDRGPRSCGPMAGRWPARSRRMKSRPCLRGMARKNVAARCAGLWRNRLSAASHVANTAITNVLQQALCAAHALSESAAGVKPRRGGCRWNAGPRPSRTLAVHGGFLHACCLLWRRCTLAYLDMGRNAYRRATQHRGSTHWIVRHCSTLHGGRMTAMAGSAGRSAAGASCSSGQGGQALEARDRRDDNRAAISVNRPRA